MFRKWMYYLLLAFRAIARAMTEITVAFCKVVVPVLLYIDFCVDCLVDRIKYALDRAPILSRLLFCVIGVYLLSYLGLSFLWNNGYLTTERAFSNFTEYSVLVFSRSWVVLCDSWVVIYEDVSQTCCDTAWWFKQLLYGIYCVLHFLIGWFFYASFLYLYYVWGVLVRTVLLFIMKLLSTYGMSLTKFHLIFHLFAPNWLLKVASYLAVLFTPDSSAFARYFSRYSELWPNYRPNNSYFYIFINWFCDVLVGITLCFFAKMAAFGQWLLTFPVIADIYQFLCVSSTWLGLAYGYFKEKIISELMPLYLLEPNLFTAVSLFILVSLFIVVRYLYRLWRDYKK